MTLSVDEDKYVKHGENAILEEMQKLCNGKATAEVCYNMTSML
jgi:hypothetical protein